MDSIKSIKVKDLFGACLVFASALLIIIGSLQLPENPERFALTDTLVVGLIGYLLGLVSLLNLTQTGIVNFLIAFGVILAAIYATRPIGRTIAEATEINVQNRIAVRAGIQAAEEILNNPEGKDMVETKITVEFEPVQRQIAEEAKKLKLRESDSTVEMIQDKVDPLVELKKGAWNCRPEGCAYQGEDFIFTVSSAQQWSGSFLIISGYFFYATSTFKQFRK